MAMRRFGFMLLADVEDVRQSARQPTKRDPRSGMAATPGMQAQVSYAAPSARMPGATARRRLLPLAIMGKSWGRYVLKSRRRSAWRVTNHPRIDGCPLFVRLEHARLTGNREPLSDNAIHDLLVAQHEKVRGPIFNIVARLHE